MLSLYQKVQVSSCIIFTQFSPTLASRAGTFPNSDRTMKGLHGTRNIRFQRRTVAAWMASTDASSAQPLR